MIVLLRVSFDVSAYIFTKSNYLYKQESPLFHYKILDKYQTIHLLLSPLSCSLY